MPVFFQFEENLVRGWGSVEQLPPYFNGLNLVSGAMTLYEGALVPLNASDRVVAVAHQESDGKPAVVCGRYVDQPAKSAHQD